MEKDQNAASGQNIQELDSQLKDLLKKAKKIGQEIEETNKSLEEEMDGLSKKVDMSINNIQQICSDLDQAEKEAGDELDKIALEQAEDLAGK
ncbi:MAG: hypothetical protein WC926_02370 [Candidatus Paceibacterota bacterium]|jgi:molecular chaperone GrpE (heat shock protein)